MHAHTLSPASPTAAVNFLLPYITGSESYPFPDFESTSSWMAGNAVDLLWFTRITHTHTHPERQTYNHRAHTQIHKLTHTGARADQQTESHVYTTQTQTGSHIRTHAHTHTNTDTHRHTRTHTAVDFLLPYITGSEPYPFPDAEPNSWMAGNAVDLLGFTRITLHATAHTEGQTATHAHAQRCSPRTYTEGQIDRHVHVTQQTCIRTHSLPLPLLYCSGGFLSALHHGFRGLPVP